jgi:hypothetical protein
MHDFRVLDAPAKYKSADRNGGPFGSRRTSGVRPRDSAPYRSSLPAKLISHPTPKPAVVQPAGTVQLRWPSYR